MSASELSEQSLKTFFPHLASVPGLIGVEIHGLDAAIAASLDPFDSGFLGHRIAWIRDCRCAVASSHDRSIEDLGRNAPRRASTMSCGGSMRRICRKSGAGTNRFRSDGRFRDARSSLRETACCGNP